MRGAAATLVAQLSRRRSAGYRQRERAGVRGTSRPVPRACCFVEHTVTHARERWRRGGVAPCLHQAPQMVGGNLTPDARSLSTQQEVLQAAGRTPAPQRAEELTLISRETFITSVLLMTFCPVSRGRNLGSVPYRRWKGDCIFHAPKNAASSFARCSHLVFCSSLSLSNYDSALTLLAALARLGYGGPLLWKTHVLASSPWPACTFSPYLQTCFRFGLTFNLPARLP
eukprot:6210010-Pleurochrysis_carterae.AAC.3